MRLKACFFLGLLVILPLSIGFAGEGKSAALLSYFPAAMASNTYRYNLGGELHFAVSAYESASTWETGYEAISASLRSIVYDNGELMQSFSGRGMASAYFKIADLSQKAGRTQVINTNSMGYMDKGDKTTLFITNLSYYSTQVTYTNSALKSRQVAGKLYSDVLKTESRVFITTSNCLHRISYDSSDIVYRGLREDTNNPRVYFPNGDPIKSEETFLGMETNAYQIRLFFARGLGLIEGEIVATAGALTNRLSLAIMAKGK